MKDNVINAIYFILSIVDDVCYYNARFPIRIRHLSYKYLGSVKRSVLLCTPHQCTIHQCTTHQCTAHQCTTHQCTAYQYTTHQRTTHQCTAHQCTAYQCTAYQCTTHQCTTHQCTAHQCTRARSTEVITLGSHTPVHHTPVHRTPVHHTPVHRTPVHRTPVHSCTKHGGDHVRQPLMDSSHKPEPEPPFPSPLILSTAATLFHINYLYPRTYLPLSAITFKMYLKFHFSISQFEEFSCVYMCSFHSTNNL